MVGKGRCLKREGRGITVRIRRLREEGNVKTRGKDNGGEVGEAEYLP